MARRHSLATRRSPTVQRAATMPWWRRTEGCGSGQRDCADSGLDTGSTAASPRRCSRWWPTPSSYTSRSRIDRSIAHARPVLGARRSTTRETARRGRRRMVVAGPLAMSSQELTHDVAQRVCGSLHDAGVDAFLVDRRGEQLFVGLARTDRRRAWEAMRFLAEEAGWYVDGERGNRRRTWACEGRRSLPRRLARCDDVVDLPGVGGRRVSSSVPSRRRAHVLGAGHVREARDDRSSAASPDSTSAARRRSSRSMGASYPGRTAFPVGAEPRALQRRGRRRVHVGRRLGRAVAGCVRRVVAARGT